MAYKSLAQRAAIVAVAVAVIGLAVARFEARRDGRVSAWDTAREGCDGSVVALNLLGEQPSYDAGLDPAATRMLADNEELISKGLATLRAVTGFPTDRPVMVDTRIAAPASELQVRFRTAAQDRQKECDRLLVHHMKWMGWRGLFTGS